MNKKKACFYYVFQTYNFFILFYFFLFFERGRFYYDPASPPKQSCLCLSERACLSSLLRRQIALQRNIHLPFNPY